ncbi:HD-GYP domain-containing protein, partial [Desulfovibrio sp. OttesenSCG-928-F20]|nr:HD-GYP domain-containing protein [Desulfovibrio sp. OttesenSCG-928-F20]
ERVAVLARDLALWLGFSAEQAEELFFAGILHDVGKIGVPDAVLTKQGKLDEEEFTAMKRHPTVGETIVRPIALPASILSGVLQHHERLDGNGYPYGASANDISDAAKILKIADVYDALVSERQYKKAWPVEKALELLQAGKGTEFDAGMVDVFVARMAPHITCSSAYNP